MVTKSKFIVAPTSMERFEESESIKKLQRYYSWQAPLYDTTRSSYLFGRKAIVKKLPIHKEDKATILEVGCATGQNLKQILQTYPNVTAYGMDLSSQMIRQSRMKLLNHLRRVRLINEAFVPNRVYPFDKVDGLLFSYTLSMGGPDWKEIILEAKENLKPGGWIAVVDYHNSGFSFIKRYMARYQVKVDVELLNFLRENFQIREEEVHSAYKGLWSYFLFVGKNK